MRITDGMQRTCGAHVQAATFERSRSCRRKRPRVYRASAARRCPPLIPARSSYGARAGMYRCQHARQPWTCADQTCRVLVYSPVASFMASSCSARAGHCTPVVCIGAELDFISVPGHSRRLAGTGTPRRARARGRGRTRDAARAVHTGTRHAGAPARRHGRERGRRYMGVYIAHGVCDTYLTYGLSGAGAPPR